MPKVRAVKKSPPTASRSSISTTTTKVTPSHHSLLEQPDDKWLEMFRRLVDYKKQHGDCKVPGRYAHDSSLASWVNNQRYRIRKLPANDVRRQKLDSIGFHWGPGMESPKNLQEPTVVGDDSAVVTVTKVVKSPRKRKSTKRPTVKLVSPPRPSYNNLGDAKSLIIWDGIYADRS